MARVVLAMSGGVDSSVAAWLLREGGHEVIGVFMRHGEEKGVKKGAVPICRNGPPGASHKWGLSPFPRRGCCSAADAADAQSVARRLGIPFYSLNFEREFGRIIDYFVAEYSAGRTPNPCIVCNTWLKFGKLFQYADSVKAEYVATGHHARLIALENGEIALTRGRDEAKDQSYSLFGIARECLPRMIFPVGDYRKEAIRRKAAELDLGVAEKPDSQEICFVPEGDHGRFVRQHRQEDTSGEIVTTEGKVVGRHSGIEQFTVGQRKGLGVALGTPHYVVRIEPITRRIVLGRRDELARSELSATDVNWLVDPSTLAKPFACRVKIRYRSPAHPATVEPSEAGRMHVRFHEPVYGVAPGQAAVCYREKRLLGGGWIE